MQVNPSPDESQRNHYNVGKLTRVHARCSGPIKRKCAVELKIVPALYKLLGYTPHSALAHIPLEWSKLGYD